MRAQRLTGTRASGKIVDPRLGKRIGSITR
jgi:hypothetical protein